MSDTSITMIYHAMSLTVLNTVYNKMEISGTHQHYFKNCL